MVHERRVMIAALRPSQDQAELRLTISGAPDFLRDLEGSFDDVFNFVDFYSHFHVLSRFGFEYCKQCAKH